MANQLIDEFSQQWLKEKMARGHFNSKKKRGNLDMISNLPQEVTDEILKRMPIKDAVKTSVLSTKWRYRWTSITELVFDKHSMVEEKQNDENLVKVVDNVLLLHNAVISKFVLNHFLENACPDLDRWIVVLSRSKMLYHVVLAFYYRNDKYKLPSYLFNCQNLRTLKLEACKLCLPSQYEGFSHLTELELYCVNLSSETFKTLVAKIPLLIKLKVSYCSHLTHIHVHAPNIEVVHLEGLYESVNFHNTPNLIKIHLSLPKVTCWVDQVHEGRNELQAVQVNVPNTESFPIADMPEGLHTTYRHLKYAYLFLNNKDFSCQISAVLFLCKISPCLEKLNLNGNTFRREPVHLYEEHFWDERLQVENVFHHLKTVTFSGFMGVQHELKFIQFILLNAVVLEAFDIFWRSGTLADNEKHILQKMMEFQRASRNSRVMFLSY